MDFVIVANAWTAALDNPTSKHQIALSLCRAGHRVLWIEGAGMRRPKFGSGADRGRMVRKIAAATQGARRVALADGVDSKGALWRLAPLLIPLPGMARVRRFNGWFFRLCARHWASRLGFERPVLINYVPVLANVMNGWGHADGEGIAVYHCVDRWDQFVIFVCP